MVYISFVTSNNHSTCAGSCRSPDACSGQSSHNAPITASSPILLKTYDSVITKSHAHEQAYSISTLLHCTTLLYSCAMHVCSEVFNPPFM